MTSDDHQAEHRPDWLIPAIMVGVAVLVLVAIGIIVAVTRSSSEPETLPEQLAAYTACLRSHDANVPLVETRGDGGVAIVLDARFVEGDFDLAVLGDAVVACDEEAPEQLGFLSSLAGGLDLDVLGGFDLGALEEFDLGALKGLGFGGLDDLDFGSIEDGGEDGFGFGHGKGFSFDERLTPGEICDALADGALPPDLPGLDRLRHACEVTGG